MPDNHFLSTRIQKVLIITTVFLCCLITFSCASLEPQIEPALKDVSTSNKVLSHTVFLAGGYGNSLDTNSMILKRLKNDLNNANSNTTLLFMGDNISEENNQGRLDTLLLNQQKTLVNKFKGQTFFLPGNNEWKSYDAKKIEAVEDYIKSWNNKKIDLQPNNVCPIEYREINDQLSLILIDSKWFISNWSRVENINIKCTDITTRRRFMEELHGYINDAQGRNILIAMHHPIFSNGKYAGKDTFKDAMTPIPLVSAVAKEFLQFGGFSPEYLNSRRYNYLRIAVSALAQSSDRITVVSGHEESLQYLYGANIRQIISGSLNSKTGTKRTQERISAVGGSLKYEGLYTHGSEGYAKIAFYMDGSSSVTFVSSEGTRTFDLQKELPENQWNKPASSLDKKKVSTPIFSDPTEYEKSAFHEFLWGERYRKYFERSVEAPVAMLDTLYGGLTVVKEGGGRQSYSIRLVDDNGKQYAMRSLRKNALKFLKAKIPGISYTDDDYEDTFVEELVSDFFTTAHPYMQLVVNPLAKEIDVNHSSPSLFYVPKQERLGALNETFGDELYFIEERPSDEQLNFKGYRRTIDEKGAIKDFESTTDMLEKIKEDESYTVDQRSYVRARVFDMLIGDWDRHFDQWRWVEYEKPDGSKEFLPVPRDRDNVFPRFDGKALNLVRWFAPDARSWQTYDAEIDNLKWFNKAGISLDRALVTKFESNIWEEEAIFIQKRLNRQNIEKAFENLPEEVQDDTSLNISETMIARLANLPRYAKKYGEFLNKTVALRGTHKDDKFEITRLPQGQTRVIIKRILTDKPDEIIYDRTFDKEQTQELWLYGLNDDDVFEVDGAADPKILIKIIGGYGKDTYQITNAKSIKVYDWEHEEIRFENLTPKKRLTDMYRSNTYHWRFFKVHQNVVWPQIGFRQDDGFFVGAKNTYTHRGLNGQKFEQKHSVSAKYYFNFSAIELGYEGVFANVFPKWNYEVEGYFASEKFSNNFFGIGNETENLEDDLGRDFYRARLQKIKLSTGIAYHTLRFRALYESFRVENIADRLFNPNNFENDVFDLQHYVGFETSAQYDLEDAKDFPSKSILMGLTAGVKSNPSNSSNTFGYLMFKMGFSHKIIPSGNLVFGTLGEVMTNFGDNYYFYHAPSLGGNNGLRGYRDERFSGKTYFYQSSDLRLRLKRFITPLAPITIGVYAGFDYGRVWTPEESSNIWHTSQGAGIWASGLKLLTFKAAFFNSVESNIVQVSLGFDF